MTLDALSLSLFSRPSPLTLTYSFLLPNISKHISELSYNFHSHSQPDHATLLPYPFNFNRTQTRYYGTWRALRALSGWEGGPPSLVKSLCPEKQDLVQLSSRMMVAMFRVSLDIKPLLSTHNIINGFPSAILKSCMMVYRTLWLRSG